MGEGLRRPFEVVDHEALMRAHPPPPEYFETAWLLPPEEIEARQLANVKARAARAYDVPFFARRWNEAGFHPEQLRTLDDLRRVPSYTVDDIRQSIEANPPLGDYQGAAIAGATEEPLRIFMSGATTGAPRPTLYTQWDREAGAILMARALYLQGVRPGDVVLNAWAYSTHNGAFAFDEALHKWLNCVVITTGTGVVTSSRRQVELAHQYGATAILTTGDYLLHLAEVAREMGLDPKKDFNLKALPNIGDRAVLEDDLRHRQLPELRLPRGAVGVGGVPRAPGAPHLRGRLRGGDRRSRDGRTEARRRAGRHLHHRDLQDRQPPVPVQHPWTSPPCTRVSSARAGAGCGAWRPSPGAPTTW